jgi:hypothetical protein
MRTRARARGTTRRRPEDGILTRRRTGAALASLTRLTGKTETSKIILQFLAHAATSSSANTSSSGLEGRIIASTPVLEAFGNARTLMNDNSSRYGKFLMLQVRRRCTTRVACRRAACISTRRLPMAGAIGAAGRGRGSGP